MLNMILNWEATKKTISIIVGTLFESTVLPL